MYLRASRLELPSWLIDMRHKISHDQDLPSLESLRKAMEFLLKWLQVRINCKLSINCIMLVIFYYFRQNIGM